MVVEFGPGSSPEELRSGLIDVWNKLLEEFVQKSSISVFKEIDAVLKAYTVPPNIERI